MANRAYSTPGTAYSDGDVSYAGIYALAYSSPTTTYNDDIAYSGGSPLIFREGGSIPTLVASLNRIADTTGLEAVQAAQEWAAQSAGLTREQVSGLTLVAAVNVAVGTNGLELVAALNAAAGTTGLPEPLAAALIPG